MRLKHLKLMATKWDLMGRNAKERSKIPQYDYIGKVRLCVPISSHGLSDDGNFRPRSHSSQAELAGDPYDVTPAS